MPTIYLDIGNNQKRCLNQIQTVCDEISKTIDLTLQTILNALEVDWNGLHVLPDVLPVCFFMTELNRVYM